MTDWNALQELLGYRFRDIAYLEAALTHASYAHLHACPSYERLEFLGDSIIGYYVARELFKQFRNRDEGDLTGMRKKLVSKDALASISRKRGFATYLRTAPKMVIETKQYCDIFEAIVGAIHQDGGLEQAEAFLQRELRMLTSNVDQTPDRDYATRVKEMFNDHGDNLQYRYEMDESAPGASKWLCVLMRGDQELARARAGSKKDAKQACARDFCHSLERK